MEERSTMLQGVLRIPKELPYYLRPVVLNRAMELAERSGRQPDIHLTVIDGRVQVGLLAGELTEVITSDTEHSYSIRTVSVADPRSFFGARAAERVSQFAVPATAERILLFLFPVDRIEEVQGDFEERFTAIRCQHGLAYATWWYRWQVLCAAASRALAVLERVAKAISPFKS